MKEGGATNKLLGFLVHWSYKLKSSVVCPEVF